MSPDPNIQAAGHSENYNRYAYVMNNPLTLNDPSGFIAQQDKVTMEDGTTIEGKDAQKIADALKNGQSVAIVSKDGSVHMLSEVKGQVVITKAGFTAGGSRNGSGVRSCLLPSSDLR